MTITSETCVRFSNESTAILSMLCAASQPAAAAPLAEGVRRTLNKKDMVNRECVCVEALAQKLSQPHCVIVPRIVRVLALKGRSLGRQKGLRALQLAPVAYPSQGG